MDFNRYITTAEFHELAELLRTEGRLVAFAPGVPFARQDERNRHCGLVEEGAFRYVHLTSRGESHVVGYAKVVYGLLSETLWRLFMQWMRRMSDSGACLRSICCPRSMNGCCNLTSLRLRTFMKYCCAAVPIC